MVEFLLTLAVVILIVSSFYLLIEHPIRLHKQAKFLKQIFNDNKRFDDSTLSVVEQEAKIFFKAEVVHFRGDGLKMYVMKDNKIRSYNLIKSLEFKDDLVADEIYPYVIENSSSMLNSRILNDGKNCMLFVGDEGVFNDWQYYKLIDPYDVASMELESQCIWNKERSKRVVLDADGEFKEGYLYSVPYDITSEVYSENKEDFGFYFDNLDN